MNDRAKYNDNLTLGQIEKIDLIRSSFSNMYDMIEHNCEPSRELEMAYTRLEEAQFWAIKSVSREENK